MTIEKIDEIFKSEQDCLKFLIKKKLNMKNSDECECGCKVSELKCYEQRSCYVCCCQHFIYPRKDTLFENSKLPLKKWFKGIVYLQQNPQMTGKKLSELLDINYKSAFMMIKKMRNCEISNFFTEV